MRRREFITLLGGAAVAWPLAARAQPKMARIGALYIGLADAESFKKELQDGLHELGYKEGESITFEFRSAEGKLDRLPELASELVRLKVDVIVALYVPSALAAKQATREIPIVIVAADPVETGIVASLARPGGNVTGVSLMSAVMIGKCVELFRDMLATTRQIAVLTNSADPLFANLALNEAERAGSITGIEIQPIMVRGPDEELDTAFAAMTRGQADAVVIQGSLSTKRVADLALERRLPAASTTRAFVDAGGLKVSPVNVRDAGEIERAIAAFARVPNGGLIVTGSGLAVIHLDLVVAAAARHKLPAVYFERSFASGGGLISYGPDIIDQYRRAASYVDRILKGEKPADLPVQAPTKYELVINLKTAKSLGLEVPATLLARADEVIE
jgi:ABC-type uncharacterized transport system substrate-binding protein